MKSIVLTLLFIPITLTLLFSQPVTRGFIANGTYTIPSGYSADLRIEVWGAGGGGSSNVENSGGGGGGGGYSRSLLTLGAGNYPVVVGLGGTAGVVGGASSFSSPSNTILVRALGGQPGSESGPGLIRLGGAGGLASMGTGNSVTRSGGTGGTSFIIGAGLDSGSGGGGGSGATATSDGTNGSNGSLGGGGAGGVSSTSPNGDGGKGGNVPNPTGNGDNGTFVGGGGGGKGGGLSVTSGNGAIGRVIVTVTSVLPIKYVIFTVNPFGNKAKLKWITAYEQNNNYFIVEKSNDGKIFWDIAKINSAKNSDQNTEYHFIDETPGGQYHRYYYRLKQVDQDATRFSYSSVVSVTSPLDKEMVIFPNVTQGRLNYSIDKKITLDPDSEILLININGNVINKWPLSDTQGTLDISFCPPGIYHVMVQGLRSNSQFKILKL